MIALAEFEQHLAWAARGNDWAENVSRDTWKGFAEHIGKSEQVRRETPEAAHPDPQFYCFLIVIAMTSGWSVEDTAGIFLAGQEVDPLHMPLYISLTYCLAPKWRRANNEDRQSFPVRALENDKLPEGDRLVIYGHVIRGNVRGQHERFNRGGTTVYQKLGIDPKRFGAGLAAYNRRFPDSTDWLGHHLFHAWKAQDEAAIEDSLKMLKGKYYPRSFGGEKEFYRLLQRIGAKDTDLLPLIAN